MDRIAIRPPIKFKPENNNTKNNEPSVTFFTWVSSTISIVSVAVAVAVASTAIAVASIAASLDDGGGDDGAVPTASVGAIIPFALLVSVIVFKSHQSKNKRRLIEAAVEITPLGVQLVSIFGTSSPPPPVSHSVSQASTDTGSTTTTPTTSPVEVVPRSFLPRQQIIDVIVIEVVWPHCVWSCVAFRILKNPTGNPISSFNPSPADGDGGNKTSNGTGSSSSTSSSSSLMPDNIEKMLQQDEIDIHPAFPEECRGWLTYCECLRVQQMLEELLGLVPATSTDRIAL